MKHKRTIFKNEQIDIDNYWDGNIKYVYSSRLKNNDQYVNPPIYEQREITYYLDDKFAKLDILIEKKKILVSELEDYKKSLIYEYITGES